MVVESMDMEIQLCLIQRNDYTLEYCGHGISALELRRGEQQGPIGSVMTPLAILSATVFLTLPVVFLKMEIEIVS